MKPRVVKEYRQNFRSVYDEMEVGCVPAALDEDKWSGFFPVASWESDPKSDPCLTSCTGHSQTDWQLVHFLLLSVSIHGTL